jgi:AcrR family transcriptional regulator
MPSKKAAPAKRSYNSSRRTLQAAQTRAEVLRAGVACFNETGWAGTTLAAIADEAGVSVETVYKGFGSKKGLLREAVGVAVAGDAEPIPLADRPEFRAMGEGSLADRIVAMVGLVTAIHERSAGVWQAIVEASSGDDEVDGWRLTFEQGRRIDMARAIELMLGSPADEQLTTMLWVLYGPETYLKLVRDSGWSPAAYEALLADAAQRLIAGG